MPTGDLDTRGKEVTQRSEPPSQDAIFEILSNQRRRFVFHYLKQQEREVYLRELAEHVAAWEYDKSPDTLDSAEAKRVKTALHQHHLPKMHDSGFVEYDAMRETVELAEDVTDLEVYLDAVPAADVPWSRYYLGLSVVGALAVAASWLDFGPAATVPDIGCGAFVVTALFVSASVHTYLNRARLRLGSTDDPPELDET